MNENTLAQRIEQRLIRAKDWLESDLFTDTDDTCVRDWQIRLEELGKTIKKSPELKIAMVGSTGAGKSTLLNALLGVQILPVSSMKPCTAVITTVESVPDNFYTAEIIFLSRAEWEEELTAIGELLSTESDDEHDINDEWDQLQKSTKDKIKAVYRLDTENSESRLDLAKLVLPVDIANLIDGSKKEIIKVYDPKSLRESLKNYLSGDGPFWPVIKSVNIKGPFISIPEGIILIDLPGVNDPNEAREEVTRKYLKDALFIWVVFNMKRGVTKDIRNLLLEQKLLRRLLIEGKVNALSLIGTHADEFSDEAIDELGLPEDCDTIEIVRKRNEQVEKNIREDLLDIAGQLASVAKDRGESFERLKHTLLGTRIFSLATPAFMKIKKIEVHRKEYGIEDADDTGVPALLKHLQLLWKEQASTTRLSEVDTRLNILLEEIAFFFKGQQKALEKRRAEVTHQREEFRSRVDQPRKELDFELGQTKNYAEVNFESYQEIFDERIKTATSRASLELTRCLDSWTNLHWATLKAIIVRKGVYTSPSTGKRFDLNADIAEPLLASIPFAWDDFFGVQIEKIIEGLRARLEKHGEIFLARIESEANLAQAFDNDTLQDLIGDVQLTRNNLKFQIEEALNGFRRTILRVRVELSDSITETIVKMMLPGYEKAKSESGSGMKKRILLHIQEHARKSAREMFDTIHRDLVEGVSELSLQFTDQIKKLSDFVAQQSDRVLHNIGVTDICARPTDVDAVLGKTQKIMADLEFLNGSKTQHG